MTATIALVTGAASGIGGATARALAARGDHVVVGYAANADGAARTVTAIVDAGGTAHPQEIHVEDTDSVAAAFDAIEAAVGPVTVLVNNAGITADGLVMRLSDADWQRVLDVDLTGAFHTIRRATPKMMRARYGRIVNVASVSADLGAPGQANYAAAKAGLIGLSRSVARELAGRGVTCNVVTPGPIVTPMTAAMGDDWLASVSGLVPVGRPGTAEECAAAIAFLTAPGSGFVTGAVLPVDGGLAMGR